MSETTNKKGFIGYEYMDVTVSNDNQSLYTDSYPNFGWVLDGSSSGFAGLSSVNLKFKRNHKIRNKAEITRLQRQFESSAKEIERLEASKTTGASAAAYAIGIVGTTLMAGATFSYLAGMLPLCIILALPAFVGWILPYFLYLRIQAKKAAQVTPLIDQQHDAIYTVCEQADGLLA